MCSQLSHLVNNSFFPHRFEIPLKKKKKSSLDSVFPLLAGKSATSMYKFISYQLQKLSTQRSPLFQLSQQNPKVDSADCLNQHGGREYANWPRLTHLAPSGAEGRGHLRKWGGWFLKGKLECWSEKSMSPMVCTLQAYLWVPSKGQLGLCPPQEFRSDSRCPCRGIPTGLEN